MKLLCLTSLSGVCGGTLDTWHLTLDTWHLTLGTWHLTLGTWHLTLGTWHLTLGTWYLTLDTWHLTLGTWHLTLDTWHLALNTWYLILDTWHLTLGTWHLALDTWHLALGTWHLTLGTWHLTLGTCHLALDTWHLTLDTLHFTLDTWRLTLFTLLYFTLLYFTFNDTLPTQVPVHGRMGVLCWAMYHAVVCTIRRWAWCILHSISKSFSFQVFRNLKKNIWRCSKILIINDFFNKLLLQVILRFWETLKFCNQHARARSPTQRCSGLYTVPGFNTKHATLKMLYKVW